MPFSYADVDIELLQEINEGKQSNVNIYNYDGIYIRENAEVNICFFENDTKYETEYDHNIIKIANENFETFNITNKNLTHLNLGSIRNSHTPPAFSSLARPISPFPFISFTPPYKQATNYYINEVFDLQCLAIKEKLTSIGIEKVVLGVSGGLDSTLALLFLVRAFKIHNMSVNNIYAFTLPCFGTTEGTKTLATTLCHLVGCTFQEINIKEAVLRHFSDIEQDAACYDTTFENAQARERTQVLMDKANQLNALVIGSSDLSEIALGFSTFSGDHISTYNLLASLPKTTLKFCLKYAIENPQLFLDDEKATGAVTAKKSTNNKSNISSITMNTEPTLAQSNKAHSLSTCLSSILDVPISPELLPHKDGKITQKTEEILGSYELQDFFIYHMCQNHYSPQKIYALSLLAFPEYPHKEILKRLKLFYKRFFANQFKRNCSPESPDITGNSFLNWKMPSNTSAKLYMEELKKIEQED